MRIGGGGGLKISPKKRDIIFEQPLNVFQHRFLVFVAYEPDFISTKKDLFDKYTIIMEPTMFILLVL